MTVPEWRVSPTLIEACRLWRADRIGDEDMMARILRAPRPESERMLVGRDIHEVLEHHGVPEPGEITAASGRVLTFAGADPDHSAAPAQVEVPVSRVLLGVPGMGDVLVTGRIDLLLPDRIVDHKCSSRIADTDALHQSWQWRAYLWMTGMEWFQFRLWRWRWSGPRVEPRGVAIDEPVDMDCRMDVTRPHLAEAVSDLRHCARSLDVENGLRSSYRRPR